MDAQSFIRGDLARGDVSNERWTLLKHKYQNYVDRDGKLWYRDALGGLREVPSPEQRSVVALRAHEENGHLGRDRTYDMVAQRCMWPGIWTTVAHALKTCSQCDRVRASFDRKVDVLRPLPLMGLFYRFHVDAAVALSTSAGGYQHGLVIVEAFSKWIDLVPLIRELTSKAVSLAFRERVLARFGRLVEVTSDNGAEYKAEFH